MIETLTDSAPTNARALRLYVAGQTPKCLTAFANLKRICEEHLGGQYEIEIVDLLENPRLAREDQSKDAADDIVDRLATAAKSAPQDDVAQCGLAEAYEWLGRWPDARAPAEACAGSRPDSAIALGRLARVYEHLGLQDLASQAGDRWKQAAEKRNAEAERRATVVRLIDRLMKQQ